MTVDTLGLRVRMAQPIRKVLRSDFVRDGAIVFGSAMAVNVLNYAIHFILSRKLGVSEYGAFASLMSALAILSIPASFMTMIVVKFVAEFHAVEDRAKIRVLSQRVLLAGSAIAVLCVLLAIGLRNAVAEYLHLSDAGSVVAAAFTLSFALLLPTMRGVLQGTQDFIALAISNSTEGIAKIVFAVTFAFAGWGVRGVFAGYALASALNLVYTLLAVRTHWDERVTRLAIDTRRLLQTMGGVAVSTSAITVMGFVDVPLVKHFFSPTDAGLYSAISVCGKMLLFVVGFIPTLVLPKATERAANGRAPGSVLWQGLLMTAVLASVGLVAFYFVPQLIVKLTYGAAFLPAARYIFIYGVAMTFLAATNVIVTYKIGLHRYNFLLPVVAMAILEPAAIQFFHSSLPEVIRVLLVGNALACILSLIGTPFSASAKSMPESAIAAEIAP